jgi:HNH endonuclease
MNKKPGDKLGHAFTFIEELPLEILYTQYSDHHRLETFAHHGLECVCCDLIGTRLVKTKDHGGGIHIDIYTEDWVLMTVDHTIPKSKGGPDVLSNKQPMCTNCNQLKGAKEISNDELRELRYRDLFKIFYRYIFISLLAHEQPCTNPKVIVWTSMGSSNRKGVRPTIHHYKKPFIKRNESTVARRLQVV